MNDYLDPATLTPESLYKLQSETWAQGAEYEREKILKMLNELVDYLDKRRPESYKAAADWADFRIRVIQNVIKRIENIEPVQPIEEIER